MTEVYLDVVVQEFVAAYKKHKTIRCVAAAHKISFRQAHKLYRAAVDFGIIEDKGRGGNRPGREEMKDVGRVRATEMLELGVPPKGRVWRYIVTCAQNNTEVHLPLWLNLEALALHYNARILVSRFVYDKRCQSADLDKKIAIGRQVKANRNVWWDKRLAPYFADDRVKLAPGLVWCGEMNTLPTAVRPLAGMEAYTGRKSAIIPHVKMAMESIATHKHEGTKFNFTTGTVTLRNYIQRKAGLKAEFHHCYGALLVEVDSDGDWFVRQLNADSEGVIHDLTLKVGGGNVTDGHRVEAVTWGDIHALRVDPAAFGANWARDDSIAKVLRPRYQFVHDLLDFRSQNHHERRDPHKRFRRYAEGEDGVEAEVEHAARVLDQITIAAGGAETIVVDSNHDLALERWLRDTDLRDDPRNAVFWLRANLAKYEAMDRRDDDFHVLEWAMGRAGALTYETRFLREDESFIICPDANGGIECGMHGHLGGGPTAFAKMGRKSNTAHTHKASIHDGVYVAGTTSLLDLEWNRGPGAWSHSSIVTYPNGKRAILTTWNSKWRAQ